MTNGLVAPEGIQALMARAVGAHRAERLLVAGAMVESAQALRIGLVDEVTGIDDVATRARVWLQELLQLPQGPMLETRRIARADVAACLRDERIDLPRFVAGWMQPDSAAALAYREAARALLARLDTRPKGRSGRLVGLTTERPSCSRLRNSAG